MDTSQLSRCWWFSDSHHPHWAMLSGPGAVYRQAIGGRAAKPVRAAGSRIVSSSGARLMSAGKGRNMSTVEVGPVDVVMLRFPGNQFKGEIAPALRDLVVRGLVRVVDLLFVYKAEDGTVGSIELAGLGPELEPAFVDLDGQLGGGLLDAEDVDEVAVGLAPNSSVAVLIVENTWAIPFVKAVRNAGGEVADQARIPASVVQRVLQGAAGQGE